MRVLTRSHNTTSPREERRGAALVEMAVVLPIFFMVVLGIIEFGRAIMVGQMVTNSVREAVRMAIVDGTSNSDVETYIKTFLNDTTNVAEGDVTVTITIEPAPGNTTTGNEIANAQPRDLITVQALLPFSEVAYITPDYMAGKNLSAKASMRHE